jgi:hypothetical protein
MADAPLTHHEILAIVEPFARSGVRVDLAASDRFARRIAFRPTERPADAGTGRPALRESMALAPRETGGWRLVRTLATPDGVASTLEVTGGEPGALLAAANAVDPRRQIDAGERWTLAVEQRLDLAKPAVDASDAVAVAAALVPVRGTVRTEGVTLTMKIPTVGGISADIAIAIGEDDPVELPDDLLAVLGRAWGRLDRSGRGWSSHVGLSGRGAARLRDAEAKLRTMAAHVARTLSEPPARYHERLRGARWRTAARRSVPLAACIALVAAAAAVPSLGIARESPVWMLIFNAPPLLLVGFFCLREMPRIELPRAPRVPDAPSWRRSARPAPAASTAPASAAGPVGPR